MREVEISGTCDRSGGKTGSAQATACGRRREPDKKSRNLAGRRGIRARESLTRRRPKFSTKRDETTRLAHAAHCCTVANEEAHWICDGQFAKDLSALVLVPDRLKILPPFERKRFPASVLASLTNSYPSSTVLGPVRFKEAVARRICKLLREG